MARLAKFVLCLVLCAACGKQQDATSPVDAPRGMGAWEVMKPLAGRFPVIEHNGDGTVTGFLEIAPSEDGVTLTVSPLNLASHPVAAKTWSSKRAGTGWVSEGGRITQKSAGLTVQYEVSDGWVHVAIDDGTTTSITASTGKVPGEVWSLRDFFKVFKGRYAIQTAGGAAPHDGANEVFVDPDADPSPEVQAPFCTSICDSGDNYFPLDKTAVYRRQLATDHAIYWFVTDGRYFTWEDKAGAIVWRNFQYKVDKKPVVLEHVIKYAGPI